MPEPFNSEMRDRQARGKDPYLPEAADGGHLGGGERGNMHHGGIRNRGSGNSSGGRGGVSRQQPKEPFQKAERRDWAETVLDNPELLLMYAQSSGDTLPATRHKFKKIMCGLDEYDDDEASIAGGGAGQYHQQQRFNGVSWSNHSGDGGGSRGGRR
ncbi:hypothetical protein N0V82_000834 [Gnomoniopsis sp. IMI 355080]|nr:hypothetical protein N0V82_000834 [Gnomoniopsis sp. IMI 355080]